MFKPFLIVSAALGLAACMPSKQSETGPETCPKSQFTSLIGTDINAAIFPLTLTYRTIYPGDAVTTDHLPERMNVQVDDNGVITGVSCG